MANRAVFLDRDGTMAKDVPYCSCPQDFELFPNTAKAVRRLNEHGFKVIVVTNQSGIGRGYFTEETLAEIHQKMKNELAREGAWVDAIYYCPHHPDDNCNCRKPKPELVLQAVRDYDIDLEQSYIIGDLRADIELGKAVGCKTILIGGSLSVNNEPPMPDAIVNDLFEAVQLIVGWSQASSKKPPGRSVLVFTGHFYPHIGGVEKHVYEVSRRLARLGFNVEIVAPNPGGAPSREQVEGFKVYRLRSWNILGGYYPVPKPSLDSIMVLWRIMRGRHDVVCTHTRFFLTSLLGLIIAKLKGVPLIHMEHGPDHYMTCNRAVYLISRLYDHTLGSLVVRSASKTIGVSSVACDFLKHLGAKETEVIPNGVDTGTFHKRSSDLRDRLPFKDGNILTFFGRLTYWKRVQDLIRSFQELQKEIHNLKLLIVGDGPYRSELETLAGNNDGILFMGQISLEELVEVLSITDIFVLPSSNESFGLSMIEAGVMGVPVVVAEYRAAREIIEDGKTGLLFTPGDVADLSQKIRRLVQDRELRTELGTKASLAFRKKFDWDRIAEQWVWELTTVGKSNE